MDDQGTEMVSFQLVAAAGEARSLAFEALEKAKAGDFDAAAKLMKQSKDVGIKAHHIQTQLLSTEAAGEHPPLALVVGQADEDEVMRRCADDEANVSQPEGGDTVEHAPLASVRRAPVG